VVVMADVGMLPSLDLSMDLFKPRKLKVLQEHLDAGYVLSLPVLAVNSEQDDTERMEVGKRMVMGALLCIHRVPVFGIPEDLRVPNAS
jgi:hypothetical protein